MTKDNEKITGCPKCGENEFLIIESITRRAAFSDEGVLDCFGVKDNAVETLLCRNCEYEFPASEIICLEINFG
jgi:predicted nucleic-acid-binding Zn-ribbon protein